MNLEATRLLRQWLPRYVKFCLVGGTGMLVDMTILHLLASPSMLGWNFSLSKALAAEAAIVSNFAGNELWTFHEPNRVRGGWSRRLGRLLRFNAICLAGIVLSILLLNLQVHLLGLNLYLANLIAILLVSFWNFHLSVRCGWKNVAA